MYSWAELYILLCLCEIISTYHFWKSLHILLFSVQLQYSLSVHVNVVLMSLFRPQRHHMRLIIFMSRWYKSAVTDSLLLNLCKSAVCFLTQPIFPSGLRVTASLCCREIRSIIIHMCSLTCVWTRRSVVSVNPAQSVQCSSSTAEPFMQSRCKHCALRCLIVSVTFSAAGGRKLQRSALDLALLFKLVNRRNPYKDW